MAHGSELPNDERRRKGGAAVGAIAATLAWAAFEAVALISSGAHAPRALAAVAFASATAILVGASVGAVFFVALSKLRSVEALREHLAPRSALVWFAALVGASFTSYAAVRAVDLALSGEGVKRIALCAVIPLAAFGFSATARASQRRLARATAGRAVKAKNLLIAVGALAIGASALVAYRFLEAEVFEALELSQYWPLAATLAGSLVGGALLRPSRRLLAASATAFLALAAGAVVHMASGADRELDKLVEAKAPGTHFALAAWAGLNRGNASAAADESATSCFPGKRPPSLARFPKVKADAPDIVLLTVDALRWDHTSLAGYARDTTPDLARWSREGAVFSSCYTPSNSTRQTFPALFTGLLPTMVLGPPSVRGWAPRLASEQTTLAEYLRAAGYDTVAVVAAPSIFTEKSGALAGFATVDRSPEVARKEVGYSGSFQVDRVIAHLSTYRKKSPKFVWAHIMDTHQPYPAGPHPAVFGKEDIDKYDAAIRFADEGIGRLLGFARSSARRDGTFVIVASDHGQAFLDHGTKYHGQSLYQEETRVPLVAWGPGVRPQRVSAPVSLLDVFPSILDVAGLPAFDSLCGSSLVPVWEKRAALAPRPVYSEVRADAMVSFASVSFIDGRRQLIFDPRDGSKELYDLEKDPFQKEDLASSRPGDLREMTDGLSRFYRERGIDPKSRGL